MYIIKSPHYTFWIYTIFQLFLNKFGGKIPLVSFWYNVEGDYTRLFKNAVSFLSIPTTFMCVCEWGYISSHIFIKTTDINILNAMQDVRNSSLLSHKILKRSAKM